VRRAVAVAVAAAALLVACGGDDEKPARDASRPATTAAPTPPVPPLTRLEAVRETQSIASQEAFKRDFSYPASAILARCMPLPPEDGRARFACRYRSPKGACRGKVEIVRAVDGSNLTRGFTMGCKGPPNI
jgi:hypothetical protein